MASDPWPSEWLRGVLEVCVLRVLADGPTYGYAISTRLEEGGVAAVKGGTLYPLLTRFETAALVTVEWRTGGGGPARKYYALTDAGRAELTHLTARWARFADAISVFVATGGAPAAARPLPEREALT